MTKTKFWCEAIPHFIFWLTPLALLIILTGCKSPEPESPTVEIKIKIDKELADQFKSPEYKAKLERQKIEEEKYLVKMKKEQEKHEREIIIERMAGTWASYGSYFTFNVDGTCQFGEIPAVWKEVSKMGDQLAIVVTDDSGTSNMVLILNDENTLTLKTGGKKLQFTREL